MSCGWDANVNFWKLYPDKSSEEQTQSSSYLNQGLPVWTYTQKNMTFNSVAVFKAEGESEPVVYATGNDRFIKEI